MNKILLALLVSCMVFSTYAFRVQNQLGTELETEVESEFGPWQVNDYRGNDDYECK